MKIPHDRDCICPTCKYSDNAPRVDFKIKLLSKCFTMPVEIFQANTADEGYDYFDWFVRYVSYKSTGTKDAIIGVMDIDMWNALPNVEES